MARSRNIKPSFFLDDELAELDPLARLLFIGLWVVADFNGRLEYRPKKIKAEVLPYDECDIEALMINLDKSRFITIYSLQEKQYVEIRNFTKHQNPHPNEKRKGTDIPPPPKNPPQPIDNKGVTNNRDQSRQDHDENVTDPADSLFLIPDSLNPHPDSRAAVVTPEVDSSTGPQQKLIATLAALNFQHHQVHSVKSMAMIDRWASEGVTPADITTLVGIMRKRYPDKDFGPAYLDAAMDDYKSGKLASGANGKKPPWARVPNKSDHELWNWAKEHGYPDPGRGESNDAYRKRLRGCAEKRLAQEGMN